MTNILRKHSGDAPNGSPKRAKHYQEATSSRSSPSSESSHCREKSIVEAKSSQECLDMLLLEFSSIPDREAVLPMEIISGGDTGSTSLHGKSRLSDQAGIEI